MNQDGRRQDLFRQGSKTFYHSSRWFPRGVRNDVAVLYSFVRTADNLVDNPPVSPEVFREFRRKWEAADQGTPAGDWIIDPFVELSRRKGFDRRWTLGFLDTMEGDLAPVPCETLEDVLRYTWGSAETIGLFMARLLDLPPEASPTAVLMGRSLQFINILRDLGEDETLGRRYLPLGNSGLPALTAAAARAAPEAFCRYLREQAEVYSTWQKAARAGYRYLPWRYRVAVKTASDLYNWTARVIRKDPMVVWDRKVKPSWVRILATAGANLLWFPWTSGQP